jgi:hypothetical protein
MFRECMVPPLSGLKFKVQGSGLVIEAGCKEDGCANTRKKETEMNPLQGSGAAGLPTAIFKGACCLSSKEEKRIVGKYGPSQGLVRFPHMTGSGILGIKKHILQPPPPRTGNEKWGTILSFEAPC